MTLWPEKSWWGPTHPGGSLWTSQPVGHAIGGLVGAIGVMLVIAAPWWAQPTAIVGALGFYWQLRVWEPEPDGTYPFRWVVYDVLTNILFAASATGLLVLLGVRW